MKKKLLFIFALLCAVAQGAWAYDGTMSIYDGSVTVPAQKHYLITGETSSNQITIENGATVTLSNVKISNAAWCILCNGDATIILADGTTNTLTCTTSHSEHDYNTDPALWVGDNATLTIQGTGTLNAQGGEGCAAIGGGWNNGDKTCGNIVIEGGIINATGGVNAAGIGADYHGKCGNITITGGTITATGGEGAAGIGCGNGESGGSGDTFHSKCGDITITNGVTRVTATRGAYAAHCIGRGNSSYTSCGKVTINDVEYWDGYEYKNGGSDYLNQNTLTFANINNSRVTISDHRGLITGTGESTTNQITLEGTSTVTLDGVNIKKTDNWCMLCNGNATVILKDGTTNTLTSSKGDDAHPALWVGDKSQNTKLIIKGETAGTGTLIAEGAVGCAAIGGSAHNDTGGCGDIEIQGGIIEATGGNGATGIGADFNHTCGDITITNGVTRVTASRGASPGTALCIGKSDGGNTSCGTVTINGVVYWDGSDYQNGGDTYLDQNTLTFANINTEPVTVLADEHYLIAGTGETTSNQITIENGATVTLSNVNITTTDSWCILCNGNATVILADGKTNRLNSGNNGGIKPALRAGNKDYTLTIKGETAGTGKLIAHGANYSAAIGGGNNNGDRTCGNIKIEGGIIEATGGINAAAIGADQSSNCGNITISGGIVTAAGGNFAPGIGAGDVTTDGSTCGDITISGGTVTATGGKGAAGIGCGQGTSDHSSKCGNITISGGTVTANGGTTTIDSGSGAPGIGTGDGVSNHKSECGTITITNGVTSVTATKGANALNCIGKSNGENTSCGTVTIGNMVGAVERSPYNYVPLADAADNSTKIAAFVNKACDVTLYGRTLYKDGSWNTLCLPFDLEDGDDTDDITFSGTPLEGATVKTFDSANFDETDGTLTLNFTEDANNLTAIEAGTPYIVKWASGNDIENPMFTNVTITATTPNGSSSDGSVTFKGTFNPVAIGTGGDNTKLYLGSDNKLYWPSKAMSINAFRAYFQLNGITAGEPSSPKAVRAFKLNFNGGEQTGITTTNFTNSDSAWYDLSGRKLSGKPTTKGLYINNGKKVVIK